MSFQVYRFEVLDEIGRQGANAVYDARDTADSSPLHLYEWTPPPRESSTAVESFNQVMGELDGAEAFSNGPRLYVAAASTEQARKALGVLQSHALFPGVWPGVIEDSSSLSADTVTPTSIVQAEGPRRRSWLGWFVTTGIVCFLMFLWCISLLSRIDELTRERSSTERSATDLSNQLSDLKRTVDSLNTDLNAQKVLVAKYQASEAEKSKTIFGLSEENVKTAAPTNYYTITLHNDCSRSTVSVAIRYFSLQGVWVTRGWWQVPFNQDINPDVYSKDGVFYLFAQGTGLMWDGSRTPGSVEAEVLQEKFLQRGNEDLNGSNKRTVSMFRNEVNSGLHITRNFTCSQN